MGAAQAFRVEGLDGRRGSGGSRLQPAPPEADIGKEMVTRPAPEPASLVVGVTLLGGLTLATGWLVLHGASFAAAIATMGALVAASVALLVRRPPQT
jgi:hypothetical protein